MESLRQWLAVEDNPRLDDSSTIDFIAMGHAAVQNHKAELQQEQKVFNLFSMVQDIITDHFAPRGENCCNSNFLRSTTLKFSGNDQRTL